MDEKLHPRITVDLIIHSFPNFNGGLFKPFLKLWRAEYLQFNQILGVNTYACPNVIEPFW